MDSTSMEQRLKRLLVGKAKQPSKSSDGLAFWEQELIDSKQQHLPKVPLEVENGTDQSPVKKSQSSRRPVELVPGSGPDQILYLSKGRRSGGTYMAEVNNNDDDYESETEPSSSSHEPVGRFCIFSLVTKFPYKYMQDPETLVSRRFFASEKIYKRGWKMHYLFGSNWYTSKPLMLVPLVQVQALIKDIENEFHIDVNVPEYPFQISFYNDGMPSPTYIGDINSKADLADAQSNIPHVSEQHGKLPNNATKSQIQDHVAWEEKMERANEAEKKKKGAKRQRKKRETKFTQGSIWRAQRYLGMLPKPLTIEPVQSSGPARPQYGGTENTFLDTSRPVPYPLEDDAVLISFDVESWELDHSSITEIGISTLDTRDIKLVAPGAMGEAWIKKIRSRHFRIKGRESLRNMRFCKGEPDMFQFGTSEYVTIEEASDTVDSCFEYPYSAGYECEGPPQTDEHGFSITREPVVTDRSYESHLDNPRTLLLVGHGIDGDIAYLSSLGSAIFGTNAVSSSDGSLSRRQRVLSSIREQFDTAILYQSLNKDAQTTSLAKMCAKLGIEAWYAHNAGNDARYTLEAFVKLVFGSQQVQNGEEATSSPQKTNSAEMHQNVAMNVETETAEKIDVVVRSETARWTGPVTDQEHEWRPVSDGALQSGSGVVESNDDNDEDEVEGSSDELPY